MSAPPVFPGQVVAGKYRVERILGEGGHGIVVSAQHLALGERVAIKVLRPDFASDREVVGRFLREARAAVRIKGEHVTRILDVGSMEDGAPYMVMEHLTGHDLRQVLSHRSRLPVQTAVDYVLQACEALAEAHGIGIVHRDVKPENLFLTKRADGTPWIKVLDFGISKAVPHAVGPEGTASFTQTQSVVGSPQYMAPEQMNDPKIVDPRTDIWGLGATLYELLAGTPPFTAETLPQIFAKILRDAPPPINRADVPPGLLTVLACCLDKDIERRFASVADLARALAAFSSSTSSDVADRISRVGAIAFQSGTRLPSTSSHDILQAFDPPAPPATTGRSTRSAALAGVLFGLIALGGVVVGLRLVRQPEPPAPLVSEPPADSSPAEKMAMPDPPSTGVVLAPLPTESASADPAPSAKRLPVATVRPHIEAPKPSATTPPTRPTGVASSRYD